MGQIFSREGFRLFIFVAGLTLLSQSFSFANQPNILTDPGEPLKLVKNLSQVPKFSERRNANNRGEARMVKPIIKSVYAKENSTADERQLEIFGDNFIDTNHPDIKTSLLYQVDFDNGEKSRVYVFPSRNIKIIDETHIKVSLPPETEPLDVRFALVNHNIKDPLECSVSNIAKVLFSY